MKDMVNSLVERVPENYNYKRKCDIPSTQKLEEEAKKVDRKVGIKGRSTVYAAMSGTVYFRLSLRFWNT